MKKSLYIVTGCSKGLGRALTAKVVLDPENQVLGISRSPVEGKENFRHLLLDLGDIQELMDGLGKIFPPGDFRKIVLINNAASVGEIAPLGSLDPKGIQEIFNLNLVAPAILINGFVKQYRFSEAEKTVVNISSGAAHKAIDGWSGYCASKAGLNQLSLVAEEESNLKKAGIRYYAVAPGIVDTDMQSEIRSSTLDNFSRGDSFRSYKSQGELNTPESVADSICYLIKNPQDFREVIQDVRDF